MTRILALVMLGGCAPPPSTSAAWIPSWSVDWTLANHRVSALGVRPTDDGVEATFVGGASTTNTVFDDGAADDDDATPACIDTSTCFELPVNDYGILTARRVAASSTEVVLASGRISLHTTADGAEDTLEIPLPWSPGGEAVAWIGGTSWASAAEGLPRPTVSCYDPRHGWLPTRMSVAVGEVEVRDGVARVPVSTAFRAGLTYEDERRCLDAAVGEASMAVEVDVVVAVGAIGVTRTDVSQSASWPEKGSDQVITAVNRQTLPTGTHAWTSQTWAFHQVVEPGRGAYLRSLSVEAEDQGARGFSTNVSPPFTLKSGFDYAFGGEVVTLDADWTLTGSEHAVEDQDAALDADGYAIWHDMPPAP